MMTKDKDIRSRYILLTMEELSMNGDAYVSEDSLYKHCLEQRSCLAYPSAPGFYSNHRESKYQFAQMCGWV